MSNPTSTSPAGISTPLQALNSEQCTWMAELCTQVRLVIGETARREELVRQHFATLNQMQTERGAGNDNGADSLARHEELLMQRMQEILKANEDRRVTIYDLVKSLPNSDQVAEVLAQLP